jgi:hypothetical protein
MKRMLIAVAALGLAAGAVRADWGGPGAPPAMPAGPGAKPLGLGAPNTLLGPSAPMNGVAADPYGLHPRLKKVFRLGGAPKSQFYGQIGYTQSGPSYNPHGYPPGAYGPAQGTLAFPHHPFVRSPRDFFMLDLNR